MTPIGHVPVYMVANLVVDDAERYREYEKGFFPILKRHGGEFVTFDDATATLEGVSPPPGRIVIFRFPSEKAARDSRIRDLSDQGTCVRGRRITAEQRERTEIETRALTPGQH